MRVVSEARAGSLGPFSPSFNIQNVLLEGMEKYLPHDVHKIVSGKLHISLTRVYDGKNVIVSEFATRDDLLQVSISKCIHFLIFWKCISTFPPTSLVFFMRARLICFVFRYG